MNKATTVMSELSRTLTSVVGSVVVTAHNVQMDDLT